MSGFRRAYTIAGVVLLAELALQFYLIAAAAWSVWGRVETPGSKDVWAGFQVGDQFANLHTANGTLLIPVTILVLIGLSFAARLPARMKWWTVGLFGLMVVQAFLGAFAGLQSSAGSALAGLHGLNALAIVGLTLYLVRANWAYAPERLAQPSAAAAPSPTSGMGASGL